MWRKLPRIALQITDAPCGQGEWLYPIDQVSNLPVRNIVAELTREAIFLRAHDEVWNIYMLLLFLLGRGFRLGRRRCSRKGRR
jgi:hypothetical protein